MKKKAANFSKGKKNAAMGQSSGRIKVR